MTATLLAAGWLALAALYLLEMRRHRRREQRTWWAAYCQGVRDARIDPSAAHDALLDGWLNPVATMIVNQPLDQMELEDGYRLQFDTTPILLRRDEPT